MLSQELFDRQVEHMLLTRRYSEAAKLLIEREARRHRLSLTSIFRKKPDNYEAYKKEITRHARELHSLSKSSVDDFLGAELDFQVNNLKRSVKDFYRVQTPSRRELSAAITSQPLKLAFEERSHGSLAKSIGGIADKELTRVNLKIRQGIAEGRPQNEILRDVLQSTKLTESQAKTLVGTHMTRAEQIVKESVYDANSDVIDGFVFTAILDSRTSKLCSSYDGLFQTRENIRVRPPLHWNCRSALVPVLKSKKAMLASDAKRLNRSVLEKVPAAKLPGGQPAKESFEDWLRRQSHQTKMKYLDSEEKVALFEKGALDLSSFFSAKGNPIGIATLRVKDNLLTYFSPVRQLKTDPASVFIQVSRPFQLIRSRQYRQNLKDLLIADSLNASQPLSLVDFRGTTLAGKRSVRRRTNNEFDPRNNSFDPFTGEARSTLYYDPDFTLYRERLDYMRESKVLDKKQKDFIESFVESLEGRVGTNQQTAIVENLRVVFERYNKDRLPWEDFVTVYRSEMNYSVTNVSRLLDRRSRARSDLFLSYKGDPKEPSVSIMGNMIPLAKLQAEKLDYYRFIQSWDTKFGRPLARRMFYARRAPWKAYFFKTADKPSTLIEKLQESFVKRSIRKTFYRDDPVGFYTKYGKTPKKWSSIIKSHIKDKAIDSIPYYKFFKKLSNEGVVNFIRRTIREEYRSIVDLEFLYNNRKKTLADSIVSRLEGERAAEAINVMSRLMQLVAEGKMTDYDGLAIAIGKELRSQWKPFGPFMGSSLQDYHAEGSKILDYFVQQKMIRVNARGVTRRATIDLDTGRASGNWKDTVSREVEVLDKDMLKLQDYNRRFELANRVGIDRSENKFYVVPGSKNYVDARGNDTGVPLITRSAYEKFDAEQLDGDFADMLNHTMSLEYEVDDVFTGFMDDLVRFKDQRGRAAYYDEINAFREEIVRRGDQGYGLMETIRYYRASKKPFTVLARIDGRGRVYYNGYLTPTGGEVVRPFLNSAKATAMTPEGLHQLKIQMGAVIGPGTEALTDAGRLTIFKRHEKDLLRVGELMSATTQRDRRIREFLDDPFMKSIEGEEVAKVARFALEYYRIYKHTGGDFSPEKLRTYRTKLMGEADASASGLQVIALSTGNRGAALTSNVMPTTRKNRIYDLVAQDVVADPRFQKLMDDLGMDLTWEDLQKAAKYQVICNCHL